MNMNMNQNSRHLASEKADKNSDLAGFRERFSFGGLKYSYFEAFFALLLFVAIRFLIASDDPLLFDFNSMFILVLVTILLLFYGVGVSVLSIVVLGAVFLVGYDVYPVYDFI